MTIAPTGSPKRCSAFAFARERRSSRRTLSPPSTTCLENFSLPGLLTVTSHFDLPNSSEANSVILFTRAVGSRRGGGWNWVGVVSGLPNPNDSGVGALEWRPRHDEG